MKQARSFDLPFRYPPHGEWLRKVVEFFCRLR